MPPEVPVCDWVQSDLLGVDTAQRERPPVPELGAVGPDGIDVTRFLPGQSLRLKIQLVACPVCGQTAEPARRPVYDREGNRRRQMTHRFGWRETKASRTLVPVGFCWAEEAR